MVRPGGLRQPEQQKFVTRKEPVMSVSSDRRSGPRRASASASWMSADALDSLRDFDYPDMADVLAARTLESVRPPSVLDEPRNEAAEPATAFRRLLVAIDGSKQAERALDEAIGLASATNAHLSVIAVAPEPSGWGPGGMDGYGAAVDLVAANEQLERYYDAAQGRHEARASGDRGDSAPEKGLARAGDRR
jgi:hypothetical protein